MIEDAKAYRNIFAVNLKTLPLGVLQAINAAVTEELEARRIQRRAARRLQFQAERAALKKFVGFNTGGKVFSTGWLGYLEILLKQDWSHLFSGDQEKKYYVYIHSLCAGRDIRFIHPQCRIKTNGMPFYVGKGTGDRAYDMKRNQGHGATLRQLIAAGKTPVDIVSIVKDKLTEPEALELESKLIYFFGTKYEEGRQGLLVNLDIPPRPEFDAEHNLPQIQEINKVLPRREPEVLPMPW